MNLLPALSASAAAALLFSFTGCSERPSAVSNAALDATNPVVLSFAFVGCNRIAYSDRHQVNASKANTPALKRILNEVADLDPDLLFLMGDLVLAESNTAELDTQLEAWVSQFEDPNFSRIGKSSTELVALPGNHEMLYYDASSGGEFPLDGAINIWLKRMSPFMPSGRARDASQPIVNGATFSFVRKGVAFVVMDTDTYNAEREEGQAPVDWINAQVEAYAKDPSVHQIFAVGHRPYYVDGQPNTSHGGFPDGPNIWPTLESNHVVAMLSAHQHLYDREQPNGQGTYQIIAGQGGTFDNSCTPQFYGYSIIDVMQDGSISLRTYGWDVGDPTYGPSSSPTTLRDQTQLTMSANANPYQRPDCTTFE